MWKYALIPLKLFLDSAHNINRMNIVQKLHFVNPTLQPWRWIQMAVMQYYDDILDTDSSQTP